MSPALTSPSSTTQPARALRSTLAAALLLVSGAASTVAAAATITLTPSTQTVNVGDSFAVKVSALDFDAAGYLGAYDLTVGLGTAGIVSLQSVTFAGSLGTGGDVSQSVTLPSFAETSLVFDLSTLQDADFELATLNFKALAAGTTSIAFSSALLGDANGDEIGASFNSARVTVIGGGVPPIPEPSTYALMFAGLGAVALAARRRRRN